VVSLVVNFPDMGKKLFFTITICVLAIYLMVACKTSQKTQQNDFLKKVPRFNTFRDFPYRELSLNKIYKETIDENSEVFNFTTGKSYFLSFQLPEKPQKPYQIIISSYMLGNTIHEGYIFYPVVVTLDSGFNVVRQVQGDAFKLSKVFINETWGLPYKYEATLALMPNDSPAEKFLLIYTTDALRTQRTSLQTLKVVPIIVPGFIGAIPAGKEKKLINHSNTGRLRISIEVKD
jgi:maltose operon periplasmic protein